MIDDTASGGEKRQYNTLTCVHCNSVVVLHPKRIRPRNWCRKCNAYVCDKAICIVECNPIKRDLEMIAKYNDGRISLLRGEQGENFTDQSLIEKQKVYTGISLG